jgi:hypothetical protein
MFEIIKIGMKVSTFEKILYRWKEEEWEKF